MTRDDVARLAGTSTAVVSYVVNGGPRPVATATRARVLQAIRELGYRPNAVARALSTRRTDLLGLVVPDATNPFFARLAHAVEQVAAAAGHLVLVGNSSFDPATEERYLLAFAQLSPAALILVDSPGSPRLRDLVADLGCRVVLLHRQLPRLGLPSVIADDYRGGWLAAEHLMAHRAGTIRCLSGSDRQSPVLDRERGFAAALRAAGRPVAAPIRCGYPRGEAMAAARRLLGGPDRPEALFVTTEEQAFGVLAAAPLAGVRVPEDLAVIAMDGLPDGEFTSPPLSTVALDIGQLARHAVTTALRPDDARSGVTVVRARTVPRASCGCVAADERG
ncbi:LacI family transcriptional regulator [Saccharothrix australiensis]|uniref:LacI family transcriptional regulator n=1 Tax=Saccharothrix australiensis TaxID=2072 RepID=A0A495VWR0_9PSEU|nr:LacI family transcriptional regulator [Saccharothrix australiensis]